MSTLKTLLALTAIAAVIQPIASEAALLPVSAGLVLNFQADNINGAGNLGMTDGQNVDTWFDTVQAGGHAVANNATSRNISTAVVDYLGPNAAAATPVTINPPTYVADSGYGIPGVRFTRTSSTVITALGNNVAVDGLLDTNSFTAFVVGNLTTPGPSRTFQMGRRNGADREIVGLANTGFRFNGFSKTYAENQLINGPHIATYVMDLTQNFSSPTYRVDGALGTAPAGGGTQTPILANFNHGFAIGAGQNNSNHVIDSLTGVVHAVVIYNRQLSAAEIDAVELALTSVYMIPEPSSSALLAVVAAVGGGWLSRRRRV